MLLDGYVHDSFFSKELIKYRMILEFLVTILFSK
jgi:hypothetical protein